MVAIRQAAWSMEVKEEFRRHLRLRRSAPLRRMLEWAESEIVIPNGPMAGAKFRAENQPAQRLLLNELDSHHWRRVIVTGPSQSGKTMVAFIIPLLYILLELGETIVCGVSDLNMVSDLWQERILPVLERTRYRNLLPRVGEGVRGGDIESAVRLGNGATARFMTGGSGDKAKASFTARTFLATEAQGLDEVRGRSDEGTKLAQLEARTRAFADRRVFLECTTTTETGLMEREYAQSSQGRLMLPCPHCRKHVDPGRQHLRGWQDASTALDARDGTFIACPGCGCAWTEADRRKAVGAAVLCHLGQSIDARGRVVGDLPRTDTLGFRWSAIHNLFQPIGETGREEWLALRADDHEAAERAICQFIWCLPTKVAGGTLTERRIIERKAEPGQGVIPSWARKLTVGVDVGKRNLHWTLIAWGDGARSHVCDYGTIAVHSEDVAEEVAILNALRELRDKCEAGWSADGSAPARPDLVLIDAGNWQDTIVAFAQESGKVYVASKGRGVTQYGTGTYHDRKSRSSTVAVSGIGWHLATLPDGRGELLEFDADRWKTWLHARLSPVLGTEGAMSLFMVAKDVDHLTWARSILSEQRVPRYVPQRGNVEVWERVKGPNHYLDCSTLGCVAAAILGVRVIETVAPAAPAPSPRPSSRGGATMPDGRPFLLTHRGRDQ